MRLPFDLFTVIFYSEFSIFVLICLDGVFAFTAGFFAVAFLLATFLTGAFTFAFAFTGAFLAGIFALPAGFFAGTFLAGVCSF